jgi:hypothetical protein
VKIFKHGRHRAPRHIPTPTVPECEVIMSRLSDERDRLLAQCSGLEDQVAALRAELGSEAVTAPIPALTESPAMIDRSSKSVPTTLPTGRTFLVPVGGIRGRDRCPGWAVDDDAS